MSLKTKANWIGSLSEYLKVGDQVDEEMADYFLNILPPAFYNGRIIQIGEPDNHIGSRATFQTIEKTSDGWFYRGTCFRGETIAR